MRCERCPRFPGGHPGRCSLCRGIERQAVVKRGIFSGLNCVVESARLQCEGLPDDALQFLDFGASRPKGQTAKAFPLSSNAAVPNHIVVTLACLLAAYQNLQSLQRRGTGEIGWSPTGLWGPRGDIAGRLLICRLGESRKTEHAGNRHYVPARQPELAQLMFNSRPAPCFMPGPRHSWSTAWLPRRSPLSDRSRRSS